MRNGHLASCSFDRTIKIWNTESGECVQNLEGHSGGVFRLRQLESGELVSTSDDNTIKIWNVEEGTCMRTILICHTEDVTAITVNSQSNRLVSRSKEGQILTWNLRTGACINSVVVKTNAGRPEDLLFILVGFLLLLLPCILLFLFSKTFLINK